MWHSQRLEGMATARPRKPGRQLHVRISSERIASRDPVRSEERNRGLGNRGMFGHALISVFLVAASFNSILTLFFLRRIAKKVYQARPNQKRKLSILSDASRIIRAHQQLFPNDESMLGFWLSLIFLLVWLSGMTYSLLAYP